MSYEETLERVIQRLDSEEKEKDKRIAELENIINAQVFPSMGDGFSGDYISGYEKALGDLNKILKEQD